MAARKGVFSYDTLTPSLKRLLSKVDAAVDLVFDLFEAQAETKMRTGARWTDRTGNARAGLMAQHDKNPMQEHSLTLYHSVHYGIWLEVRWSGRYAIIGPVMFKIADEMSRALVAAINRATREV